MLRTALSHFDRILTQRDFQSLMQQEMVRMRRGESEALPTMVENVFKPLLEKLQEAVRDGMRPVSSAKWIGSRSSTPPWAQTSYFLSAPMMSLILRSTR